MICLFKFCFHDVTWSLQRTKNSKKKDDMLSFPSAGAQHEWGAGWWGALPRSTWEGSAERHRRKPRLGQAVDRTLTCSQRAPSKSAGPGVYHPREVLPSLRNHTRHPFLGPVLKSEMISSYLSTSRKKKLFGEEIIYNQNPPLCVKDHLHQFSCHCLWSPKLPN